MNKTGDATWNGSLCVLDALVSVCVLVQRLLPYLVRHLTAGPLRSRATTSQFSETLSDRRDLRVLFMCSRLLSEAANAMAIPSFPEDFSCQCIREGLLGNTECKKTLYTCGVLCDLIAHAAMLGSSESAAAIRATLHLVLQAAVPLLAWAYWDSCESSSSSSSSDANGSKRSCVIEQLDRDLDGGPCCFVSPSTSELAVGAGAVLRSAAGRAGYIDRAAARCAIAQALGREAYYVTQRVLRLLCVLELAYESPSQDRSGDGAAPPLYVVPCALCSLQPPCHDWDPPPLTPPATSCVTSTTIPLPHPKEPQPDRGDKDPSANYLRPVVLLALNIRGCRGRELAVGCADDGDADSDDVLSALSWQQLQARLGGLLGVPGGAGTSGMALRAVSPFGASRIDMYLQPGGGAVVVIVTSTEKPLSPIMWHWRALCFGLFSFLGAIHFIGLEDRYMLLNECSNVGIRALVGRVREGLQSLCEATREESGACWVPGGALDEALAALERSEEEALVAGPLHMNDVIHTDLIFCNLEVLIANGVWPWNQRCGLTLGASVRESLRIPLQLCTPMLYWLVCTYPCEIAERDPSLPCTHLYSEEARDIVVALVPVAPCLAPGGAYGARGWAARFDRSLWLLSGSAEGGGGGGGGCYDDGSVQSSHTSFSKDQNIPENIVLIPPEFAHFRQNLISLDSVQDPASCLLLRCLERLGVRLPPYPASCAPLRLGPAPGSHCMGHLEEEMAAWLVPHLLKVQLDHYDAVAGVTGAYVYSEVSSPYLCECKPHSKSRSQVESALSRFVGKKERERSKQAGYCDCEEEERVAASHAALLSELGAVMELQQLQMATVTVQSPGDIEAGAGRVNKAGSVSALSPAAVRHSSASRLGSASSSWGWALRQHPCRSPCFSSHVPSYAPSLPASTPSLSVHGLYALVLPSFNHRPCDRVSELEQYRSRPDMIADLGVHADVLLVPICSECLRVSWSLAPPPAGARARSGDAVPSAGRGYILDPGRRKGFFLWASCTLSLCPELEAYIARGYPRSEAAYSILPLDLDVLPLIDTMSKPCRQRFYEILGIDETAGPALGAKSLGVAARSYFGPSLQAALGRSVRAGALLPEPTDPHRGSDWDRSRLLYLCRACACEEVRSRVPCGEGKGPSLSSAQQRLDHQLQQQETYEDKYELPDSNLWFDGISMCSHVSCCTIN